MGLPGIDLNLRTLDLGAAGVDIDAGATSSSVDIEVALPVAGASLHIGLDRLLHSTSPIDRLLHSPDPLARYRAGNVPSDPSPIATRGMTVRVGDIHAEIATRHDIGGMRTPDALLRGDVRTGGETLVAARATAGVDTRGVAAVRDETAAAALPQRIDGAAGALASGRGLQAHAAVGIAPGIAAGGVAGAAIDVSFHGLVNVLDRAGAPIATARDAPIGAVLLYARADGSTAVELRTAAGFAGATGLSAAPLTGDAPGRSGERHTLIGVFVTGESLRPPPVAATPVVQSEATAAQQSTAAAAAGATTVAGAQGVVRSEATAAQQSTVSAAAGSATVASAQGVAPDAVPPPAATRTDGSAEGAVPPPDGSEIPAGQPAAPGEATPGFGDATPSADASDRPYIHAIWYDILALRFEAAGVMLLDRTTALRDVVWATAMEHGPFAAGDGSDVLSRVAAEIDLAHADDAAIVAALYAERSRLDAGGGLAHYPEVLPFDQDRVRERLASEAELAAHRVVAG